MDSHIPGYSLLVLRVNQIVCLEVCPEQLGQLRAGDRVLAQEVRQLLGDLQLLLQAGLLALLGSRLCKLSADERSTPDTKVKTYVSGQAQRPDS